MSDILRTFVISNADEDVADNRHPFLPVVLPSSGVCKPFQYDSRNFRYALVAPPISNFLDSPAQFPHNSFNNRRSPGGNQSPLQPAANITEHPDFCPSQVGSRRLIPSPLKISGVFCTLCKKWEGNIRNPCAVKFQSGIIGRDAPFYSV